VHRNGLRRWFEMNELEDLLGEMGLTTCGVTPRSSAGLTTAAPPARRTCQPRNSLAFHLLGWVSQPCPFKTAIGHGFGSKKRLP